MADVDTTSSTLLSTHEIPIINLSLTDSNSTATEQRTTVIAKQLNDALSTKGMAFLINHGIAVEKITSVFKLMETFCSLPESTRDKYRLNSPDEIHGYVPPGMERLVKDENKMEFRHSYNILRLSEKLPNDEKCNFQEVVGNVVEDFYNLATFLLKVIAKALDIDPEVLLDIHKGMLREGNLSVFRMLYYPPIEEDPSPKITRCGEHSDWGTFTLLTQDVEGGLEVLQEGQWRRVGHLPGSILINAADMMDAWTCSKYKTLIHRVVVPENADVRTKGRCSIAFFVQPDEKTLVDPSALKRKPYNDLAENCGIKDNNKNLSAREYMKYKMSSVYNK